MALGIIFEKFVERKRVTLTLHGLVQKIVRLLFDDYVFGRVCNIITSSGTTPFRVRNYDMLPIIL